MPSRNAVPVPCPQAQAYIDSSPWSLEPMWERPVSDLREEARRIYLDYAGVTEPVADIEVVDAGGAPGRLYWPRGGERDVLVWMHGGAWMTGDLDMYDAFARQIANRGSCAVLTVDYRLAPEHRYPAATDDCWNAVCWASRRFDRIAIGGDSSGGNLAAAVALRARDAGMPLALQLLVYPVLDSDIDAAYRSDFVDHYETFAGIDGFAHELLKSIQFIWDEFVPDRARQATQDASPMRAASLAGCAATLLITAEHDVFNCEADEYERRLAADGVPVERLSYEGQIHGFFEFPAVMDDAHDARDKAGAALRAAFER